MTPYLGIRNKIKKLREEKGISQSHMAELLHMDERNYKRLESGERKGLDLGLLDAISKVLEVELPDLVSADSVNIEYSGETSNEYGSAAGAVYGDINVTNNTIDPELKNTYETVIASLQALVEMQKQALADKDKIIEHLSKK